MRTLLMIGLMMGMARSTVAGAAPALVAGVIGAAEASSTTITVSQQVAPAGGNGAITLAVYRHTSTGFTPPGTGTLIGTSLPLTDTGRSAGVAYYYRVVYTDASSASVLGAEVACTIAGGGTPDLDMNFSSYANSAALLADTTNFGTFTQSNWSGSSGSSVAITIDTAVTDPAVASDRTMRYRYITGASPQGSAAVVRSYLPFPGGNRREVWTEFRVRWTSNFSTDNPASYPNDQKLIFGDNFTDSFRWGFHVGMDGDVSTGTDHTIGNDWPNGSGFPADGNRLSLKANALWDGNWHVIRIYIRHSSGGSAGAADGAYKLWIDGTLYRNVTGIKTWAANGSSTELLKSMSFCHNLDDGPANTTMDINWSRIRYYYSDPGW